MKSTIQRLSLVGLVASSLMLGGCVIAVDGNGYKKSTSENSEKWEDREQNNRKHLQLITVNDTLQAVSEKMGSADFNEVIKINDTSYQVLYYRTQRVKKDGMTTKEECTPIIFLNQLVVGWGNTYLESL
jgi:hypothetical protein